MWTRSRWLVWLLLAPATVFAFAFAPPTVTSSSPADGDTSVARDALITLSFSAPMQTTDTEGALRLQAGPTPLTSCDARWQWNAQRTSVSCQPWPPPEPGAQLRVTVGTGARDDAGDGLAAASSFAFTIAGPADAPTRSSLTPTESPDQQRRARLRRSFAQRDAAARRAAFLCSLGAASVGDSIAWVTRNRVVRLTTSSQVIHTGVLSCSVITAGLAVAAGLSFGQGLEVSATLRRGVAPAGLVSAAELRAEGEGGIFRGWLFTGLALVSGVSTMLVWILGPPGAPSVTVFPGPGGVQAGFGGSFP